MAKSNRNIRKAQPGDAIYVRFSTDPDATEIPARLGKILGEYIHVEFAATGMVFPLDNVRLANGRYGE
jgi:hypothetical protein